MKLQTLKFFDRALALMVGFLPKKAFQNKLNQPKTILIIKLSAMGDALCLLPSIRNFAVAFPGVTIDWLTTNRSSPKYFENLPFLNRIIVAPTSVRKLPLFLFRIVGEIRKYDLVIDYDQYYQLSELLAYFGKENAGFLAPLKGKSFLIREPYQPLLNEKAQFLKLTETILSRYLVEVPTYEFTLPELLVAFMPSEHLLELDRKIKTYSKRVVVIYPGSSTNASFRRLEVTKYLQVISQLSSDYVFLIAGGPDELDLKLKFQMDNPAVFNLIGMLTLQEWTWLFRNSVDLIIGNDGGMLHVAESQGVPVVGIFGPALFRKWGSINPKSIGVEIELDCRPCLRNYLGIVPNACQYGSPKCLDAIQPEAIINAAKKVLLKN